MGSVIGFTWPPYHDSAVSVIVDGHLVFASEEERFTRHKHAISEWPIYSMLTALRFLEAKFQTKPADIDAFAITVDPKISTLVDKKYAASIILNQVGGLRLGSYDAIPIDFFERLQTKQTAANYDFLISARMYLDHVFSKLGEKLNKKIKIYPVAHHLSHAASAYYFSGFNSSASVVVDARGEGSATTIWKVKNGDFKKILDIHWREGSLGSIFDGVSLLLKFKLREGPGKVMGLAPYGIDNNDISNRLTHILRITEGSRPYALARKLKGDSYYHGYREFMLSILGDIDLTRWNPRKELDKNAVNLAYSTQKLMEEAMLSIVKWAKDNTGETNLCMAGGVALNAKANMGIYYSHLFNKIFIFPSADDAGASAGAAAYVYEHVLGKKMKHRALSNVYLGSNYDREEIKSILRKSKLNAEYLGDDIGYLAKLITQNKIIGIYQNRSEFGPRALGNRSMVADPRNKKMRELVNQIKGREWWRPLAASLLIDDMNTYFEDPTYHQFMVLMLKVKNDIKERIPSVCHVDSTSRVQIVKKSDNKNWYDLMKEFKALTGEGLILNTSFNLAGEPLVETPTEALKSFACGGLDAIYLDGWLIKK